MSGARAAASRRPPRRGHLSRKPVGRREGAAQRAGSPPRSNPGAGEGRPPSWLLCASRFSRETAPEPPEKAGSRPQPRVLKTLQECKQPGPERARAAGLGPPPLPGGQPDGGAVWPSPSTCSKLFLPLLPFPPRPSGGAQSGGLSSGADRGRLAPGAGSRRPGSLAPAWVSGVRAAPTLGAACILGRQCQSNWGSESLLACLPPSLPPSCCSVPRSPPSPLP